MAVEKAPAGEGVEVPLELTIVYVVTSLLPATIRLPGTVIALVLPDAVPPLLLPVDAVPPPLPPPPQAVRNRGRAHSDSKLILARFMSLPYTFYCL